MFPPKVTCIVNKISVRQNYYAEKNVALSGNTFFLSYFLFFLVRPKSLRKSIFPFLVQSNYKALILVTESLLWEKAVSVIYFSL